MRFLRKSVVLYCDVDTNVLIVKGYESHRSVSARLDLASFSFKMSKKKTQGAAAAVEAAMQSSSIERGHRLGNYHNYYFHHPPSNRIDVLEEQGLIHCIARRLLEKCKFSEISPRKKQRTNDQTTCDQAGNTIKIY